MEKYGAANSSGNGAARRRQSSMNKGWLTKFSVFITSGLHIISISHCMNPGPFKYLVDMYCVCMLGINSIYVHS